MSKHTPGPWVSHVSKVDEFTGNEVILIRAESPLRGIVSIEDDHEEAQANARLIAAAPEMLRALKEARKQLAWCNKMFGPHASTNVVLHKLDSFIVVEEADDG
jgi:hypothetical protein